VVWKKVSSIQKLYDAKDHGLFYGFNDNLEEAIKLLYIDIQEFNDQKMFRVMVKLVRGQKVRQSARRTTRFERCRKSKKAMEAMLKMDKTDIKSFWKHKDYLQFLDLIP